MTFRVSGLVRAGILLKIAGWICLFRMSHFVIFSLDLVEEPTTVPFSAPHMAL